MAGCNMAKICRSKWKYDLKLKADLIKYVKERMQRIEILDFMQKDYPIYKWSLRTLDRRLSYFNIKYIDENVRIDDVREAVREELEGPGKLLGYRTMTQKIRQKHDMKVPRDLVHNVMYDLDAEGLEARAPGAKKRKPKGHFITLGPDWTYSVDGHDKLMGFQNSTFPLAIYGCIDTASRKLLWLKIWTTNSNPILVGKWYIQALFESGILPNYIRLDKGTETITMCTIHAFLRSKHEDLEDPTNSILFGPSPSNQVCVFQFFPIYNSETRICNEIVI